MIWLYGSIILGNVILWIIAKLIVVSSPKVNNSYSRPFLAPATLIYKWMQLVGIRFFPDLMRKNMTRNRKIGSSLHRLAPGEKADSQILSYKVEKISMALMIVCIGSVLGLLVSFMAAKNGILIENSRINRGDYGETNINANLTAGIVGDDGNNCETDIYVSVPARIYSKAEADTLLEQMDGALKDIVLGSNDSAEHVIFPVNLVKNIEGYPFTISWECDNYELVDTDGQLHNEELKKPTPVSLMADCIYEHNHWYISYPVLVCPPEYTREQQIKNELDARIAAANDTTASESQLVLPASISYGDISWREKIKDDSPLILGLTIMLCLLIAPAWEADIKKKLKNRSRDLLIAYPTFVSTLSLYLNAGMSVKNSFLRMGETSENKPDKDKNSLDKELIITCNELQMGIAEIEAYQSFGKRCGNREYSRFSTLLIQNLRKGSTDLMTILSEEAEDAFVLRKNEARRLGEEASTKLLLPMVMMLAVVMVIIMVPAYMSFSS